MEIKEFLDQVETLVRSEIPRKKRILETLELLVDDAKLLAESSENALLSLDERPGVSIYSIYKKSLSTGNDVRLISSAVQKHFCCLEEVLHKLRSDFRKIGYEVDVEKTFNGTTLYGLALTLKRSSFTAIDEPEAETDEPEAKIDEGPSVDKRKVTYRLLDYYRDVGVKTKLQSVMPRYVDIGSGRRLLMLLVLLSFCFMPFLILNVIFPSNESMIYKFLGAVAIFLFFWQMMGAFYLAIDKKKSFAPLPAWLHGFVYPKWDYCQLYTTILEKVDFLDKPVMRLRVGRLEADCPLCQEEYQSKIDVLMSVWRPSKVRGQCERAGHDHSFTCRPTERAGELV